MVGADGFVAFAVLAGCVWFVGAVHRWSNREYYEETRSVSQVPRKVKIKRR